MACREERAGARALILIDTHVLIWLSVEPEKIGGSSRARLLDAFANDAVTIAAITPWEIATKASKAKLRLAAPTSDWMRNVLEQTGITVAELAPETAVDAGQLPGDIHGDPADRIIIATARALGCPLMTADREILRYAQAGHVNVIDVRH